MDSQPAVRLSSEDKEDVDHQLPSTTSHSREVSGAATGRTVHSSHDVEEDDATVCEHDPAGRFSRYDTEVGHGRFKTVYKAYDEKQGIDVAWSKINAADNHLTDDQAQSIVAEMSKGLGIDHPNIIRCYLCYQDHGTINLITEYFTSGNLRDYRQRHKHLGTRAVKKWARQILLGLAYLHSRQPAMVHGDLRCDKLYVNGHTGEIKIGDLGLATLLSRRYPDVVIGGGMSSQAPTTTTPNGAANGVVVQHPATELSVPSDVFCFGLVMLELMSLRKLDAGHCGNHKEILASIEDEAAQAFIAACLGPDDARPTAQQLLEDPFLKAKSTTADLAGSATNLAAAANVASNDGATTTMMMESSDTLPRAVDDLDGSVSCEVGMVRGEDYTFHFSGTITDGVLSFRLHMQYEGDEGDERGAVEVGKRTINFLYDPEVDTPDKIAEEISGEFNLSSTDRDICAAALSEWLAKNSQPD